MCLPQTIASRHWLRVLLVAIVAALLARQIGTLLIASSVTGLWLRLEQLAGLNDFAVDVLDQHIASKVSGKLATMSIEDGKERDVRVVVDVLLDNESARGSMSK